MTDGGMSSCGNIASKGNATSEWTALGALSACGVTHPERPHHGCGDVSLMRGVPGTVYDQGCLVEGMLFQRPSLVLAHVPHSWPLTGISTVGCFAILPWWSRPVRLHRVAHRYDLKDLFRDHGGTGVHGDVRLEHDARGRHGRRMVIEGFEHAYSAYVSASL